MRSKLIAWALACALALGLAMPASAQTLYTLQVFDPLNPTRVQVRVTTTLNAAAALVQAGVATPLDPTQYAYLMSVSIGGGSTPAAGTLDFSVSSNSALIL